MTLAATDFAAFFEETHGFAPFPWQERLAIHVAEHGAWPETLNLPTGSGKTAAIDIAVFHLALEASRGHQRRAPVRIAFIVDRRLVVDDAFERANTLARALSDPQGPVTERVAGALAHLAGDGPPLVARRLRGGIPREDDWARTPMQPTVLCSTVDQIGSRLLFRGFGVSDRMKSVHAGLIGCDCLLLLDEVHLAEPFRQTLRWVHTYKSERWREVDLGAPWGFALLSATPVEEEPAARPGSVLPAGLNEQDWAHPVLGARLNASKPVRLLETNTRKRADRESITGGEDADDDHDDLTPRIEDLLAELKHALTHFQDPTNSVANPAICLVVNRVVRARRLYEHVVSACAREIAEGRYAPPLLMIGPARSVDRDELVHDLEPIRTRVWRDDQTRRLDRVLIVIATQCIEAGVDLDFDGMITEAASMDALRQRFGRLNRAGRDITPYGCVIARKSELSARHDDPVYGNSIRHTWIYCSGLNGKTRNGVPVVDFGIAGFERHLEETPAPAAAISEKPDAPVLMPAHVDLLSHTSPIPLADPDIRLFLHGPKRQPDSVRVIWRADFHADSPLTDERASELLTLVPPRAGEAIELPLWVVRDWLRSGATRDGERLADVPSEEPTSRESRPRQRRPAFRWMGDDERSGWMDADDLSPGDTIVVPSTYGGADMFGWNPGLTEPPVADIARNAAAPFAGRRFAVRIAPGLIGSVPDDAVAVALAAAASRSWRDAREALLALDLPNDVLADLRSLDRAVNGKVVAYPDLYGHDTEGRPRGILFHAPFGIGEGGDDRDEPSHSTEDDMAGSLPGFSIALKVHNDDVANAASAFAEAAGLAGSRVNIFRLAGLLHDAGKADARFQAWLQYGDPLGAPPDELLAKSARRLPYHARERSGLPAHWRHEALSVRLACNRAELNDADDPELVIWLIGTHHGYGRPLYPHTDPLEATPNVGPQALQFNWRGFDWPTLFVRLKARYGVWELAWLEALMRLADHRASGARVPRGNA